MTTEPPDIDVSQLDKGSLSGLLQASFLLNAAGRADEVLDELMRLANTLLRTEASSLLLLERGGKRLFFIAAAGEREKEVVHLSHPVKEGIVGWVIEHKEPYVSNDVSSDPLWSKGIAKKLDFETRSILCVPLVSRGALIGALEVINTRGGGGFDERDVTLLSALASHAAVALENARRRDELRKDSENLLDTLRSEHPLIGTSPSMTQMKEILCKVAPADSTVLIRGESGTGKELIAKTIHYNSARRQKPFVCVNCTLFSETLIESELFGHEQGSFTGATKRRIGRFEQADGGTVFLDEVGSVSREAQLKLLRVLEEKEFERLGGSKTINVDVRVIAATNENLEEAISRGRFREDLYYRLKVIEIFASPLRERGDDIRELVMHFLEEQSRQVGRAVRKVDPEAMRLLCAYRWPGNVRELKNSIERAVVLGSGDTLLPEHLPSEIRSSPPGKSPGLTLEAAERNRIEEVLALANGNKSRAAKMLGISRNRLDRKLKSYKSAG